MASNKTPLPKAAPGSEKIKTEADARSIRHRADKAGHNSYDAKSRDKTGNAEHAGGGAKQRNH